MSGIYSRSWLGGYVSIIFTSFKLPTDDVCYFSDAFPTETRLACRRNSVEIQSFFCDVTRATLSSRTHPNLFREQIQILIGHNDKFRNGFLSYLHSCVPLNNIFQFLQYFPISSNEDHDSVYITCIY